MTGRHRMQGWIERHPNRTVRFPFAEFGARRTDPFFNVNTPEDYTMAETILKEQSS
ncbi:MAG: hypothetical protein WBP94_10780 [Rhodomicrobiaceae bacterium]